MEKKNIITLLTKYFTEYKNGLNDTELTVNLGLWPHCTNRKPYQEMCKAIGPILHDGEKGYIFDLRKYKTYREFAQHDISNYINSLKINNLKIAVIVYPSDSKEIFEDCAKILSTFYETSIEHFIVCDTQSEDLQAVIYSLNKIKDEYVAGSTDAYLYSWLTGYKKAYEPEQLINTMRGFNRLASYKTRRLLRKVGKVNTRDTELLFVSADNIELYGNINYLTKILDKSYNNIKIVIVEGTGYKHHSGVTIIESLLADYLKFNLIDTYSSSIDGYSGIKLQLSRFIRIYAVDALTK